MYIYMRIDRFFIQQKINNQDVIYVTDENVVRQWRKVLRLSPGAEVDLCDNSGKVYRGILKEFDKGATVEIANIRDGIVPEPLTLYMALIKKDAFELVVEKATELGVSYIVPIRTDHSVKHNLRFDRLQKIAREASEQSERAVLPEITDITFLEDAASSAPAGAVALAARTCNREGLIGADALFVGPEGGWSERELRVCEEQGIKTVCLGETILRAETAALAGIAKTGV